MQSFILKLLIKNELRINYRLKYHCVQANIAIVIANVNNTL
jgi:hypothetical protein